jgi:RimJ/RimL family protein N-acetyltransferase
VISPPGTSIRAGRVVLTPLAVSDAAEMVGVLADPTLYAFTGGEAPDLETLTARYHRQVAGATTPGERWCNWIVRLGDSGTAIGYVQATITADATDVAWVVGVAWQGRGLAREAVGAMVAWLRAHGTMPIRAHIHPEHRASERVAEAIGLALTAEVDEDGERVWSSPSPSPTTR